MYDSTDFPLEEEILAKCQERDCHLQQRDQQISDEKKEIRQLIEEINQEKLFGEHKFDYGFYHIQFMGVSIWSHLGSGIGELPTKNGLIRAGYYLYNKKLGKLKEQFGPNYTLVHYWSTNKECNNVDRNIFYNNNTEYYVILAQKTHEYVDKNNNRYSLWKFGEKTFCKNSPYVVKSEHSKLSTLLELYDMYSWQLVEDNLNFVVAEEIEFLLNKTASYLSNLILKNDI